MKLKAILETEFDSEVMCDETTLKEEYDGDWNKLMSYLVQEEGMGIFDEIKFVRVEELGS
jgi:hypothetical protein